MALIKFNIEKAKPMFQEWLGKYPLSDEALDELAEITDVVIEFEGMATPFELVDGKIFKTIFRMLKPKSESEVTE